MSVLRAVARNKVKAEALCRRGLSFFSIRMLNAFPYNLHFLK